MRKKSKNIYSKVLNKIAPIIIILYILIKWQILSITGIVPKFMLPSPFDVIKAFINDFPLLMHHMKVTLVEAFLGLGMGVILGFFVAIIMDMFEFFYKSIYPILIITQTIPTVAIAPLLVLWLGYGILPKIVLIVLTSFFPITIGLLDGFKSADKDALKLMKTMGATQFQNFVHIKLPSSIGYFFAGLRISVSYSIIGAVVAEWLGGFDGLGVYMTRVRKSYSFDKMFAVIFLISIISLFLMFVVKKIQKLSMPWEEAI
ncbi:ABC transporter permease [Leptotrichia sp. oral taxon 847]|uniref:ABC transporter permease n=1 Tax=Leptotrichia sp. oral taxon 847 TaxID=1785996 RepID=UPI0007681DE4|nr:ABC transporter permease [Leptotrichia sp. oral taxon 847]AMD94369.1 nitrate ABC transporter permease [Leptotrichia sp. oral taxon 847]